MTKSPLLIPFLLLLSSETAFSRKGVVGRPAPPQSPEVSCGQQGEDTTGIIGDSDGSMTADAEGCWTIVPNPETPEVPRNTPLPTPAVKGYSKDEELDLSHNPVPLTRPKVAALQNLKKLVLDYNDLHAIPPYIGDFRNLEVLSMCYNHLHRLPESLGNLENLKELNLSGNRISNLPQSLSRIKGLRIVMSNNRLSIGMQEALRNQFPDATFYFWNQEDEGANEGGG